MRAKNFSAVARLCFSVTAAWAVFAWRWRLDSVAEGSTGALQISTEARLRQGVKMPEDGLTTEHQDRGHIPATHKHTCVQ